MEPISRDTRSRILWLVVLVVLCSLAALGGRKGGLASRSLSSHQPAVREPENAGLFIPADRLVFGEPWEQQAFPWVLPIENRGTSPVHVTGFSSSCLCTSVEPKTLTIPPGGQREVRLLIDLTKRCQTDADKSLRDYRIALIPLLESAEPRRTAGWILSGRVRSPIHFDTAMLDLGQHSVMAQPLKATRTLVTTHVPLMTLEVSRKSPRWDVRVQPTDSSQTQFEILVAPSQPLALGEIKFDFALVPVRTTGERLPEQSLTVLGQIVADVKPSLPSIHFGAMRVGTIASEILTLHSLTSKPVDVLGMEVEGSGLSVVPVDRPEIDAPTFQIRQQVQRKGEQSGKVVFRVRVGKGEVTEVSVPVAYNGIQGTEK